MSTPAFDVWCRQQGYPLHHGVFKNQWANEYGRACAEAGMREALELHAKKEQVCGIDNKGFYWTHRKEILRGVYPYIAYLQEGV